MITKYLNALKTEKNLSWQEISDLSNVPLQTVRNIFSGETANPGINAVVSIVTALGGSMDDMIGIERPREKSSFEVMTEKYEARLENTTRSYEARVISTKEVYERRLAQQEEAHNRQVDQLNESLDSQVSRLNESHVREITQLTESNERRITELNASFERRIGELNESFERRIAENAAREEKRVLENSTKEEKRLAEAASREQQSHQRFYAMLAVIVILVVAVFYLILDAMHGNWGIFQYQELLAAMGNTAGHFAGALGGVHL